MMLRRMAYVGSDNRNKRKRIEEIASLDASYNFIVLEEGKVEMAYYIDHRYVPPVEVELVEVSLGEICRDAGDIIKTQEEIIDELYNALGTVVDINEKIYNAFRAVRNYRESQQYD